MQFCPLTSRPLLLNRCEDVYLAVRVEGDTKGEQDDRAKADSYISLSQSGPEHRGRPPQEDPEVCSSELSVLQVQLRQAEEAAHKVQREVTAAAVHQTHNGSFNQQLCSQ